MGINVQLRQVGGGGAGIRGTVNIAASGTEDVDTVSLSLSKTIKWIINIDNGGLKSQSLEVLARARSTSCDYSRYSIAGEDIDYDLVVTSDGSDMTLTITNNEGVTITVKFLRFML